MNISRSKVILHGTHQLGSSALTGCWAEGDLTELSDAELLILGPEDNVPHHVDQGYRTDWEYSVQSLCSIPSTALLWRKTKPA